MTKFIVEFDEAFGCPIIQNDSYCGLDITRSCEIRMKERPKDCPLIKIDERFTISIDYTKELTK